jgi:hypothetical protein
VVGRLETGNGFQTIPIFGFHFEFFVLSGNASANFIEAISILLLLTINYDNRSRFPLMEKK